MLRVAKWRWWDRRRRTRELRRIELVGLAAEIATVAAHAESLLVPEGRSRRADALRQRCRFYISSADQVLCPSVHFDHLSDAELRAAVQTFRVLQRKLVMLRPPVELATDTMLG